MLSQSNIERPRYDNKGRQHGLDRVYKLGDLEPGDWICVDCKTINYRRRIDCRRCGKLNSSKASHPMENAEDKMRTWECKRCGLHNEIGYAKCRHCNSNSPPGLLSPRDGDWICSSCFFFNFAKEEKCQKCHKALSDEKRISVQGPKRTQVCSWRCVCRHRNLHGCMKCTKCLLDIPAEISALIKCTPHSFTCHTCHMLNFIPHLVCSFCGTTRADKTPPYEVPGCWKCSLCSMWSAPFRPNCTRCNRLRDLTCLVTPSQNLAKSPLLAGRPGDWMCHCRRCNFSTMQHCPRCQTPKSDVRNKPFAPSGNHCLVSDETFAIVMYTQFLLPQGFWSCHSCGCVNAIWVSKCLKCNEPYSNNSLATDASCHWTLRECRQKKTPEEVYSGMKTWQCKFCEIENSIFHAFCVKCRSFKVQTDLSLPRGYKYCTYCSHINSRARGKCFRCPGLLESSKS